VHDVREMAQVARVADMLVFPKSVRKNET
jgi:hypothetical protein